jgi:hypothetical protein
MRAVSGEFGHVVGRATPEVVTGPVQDDDLNAMPPSRVQRGRRRCKTDDVF